jgi:Bromodomain
LSLGHPKKTKQKKDYELIIKAPCCIRDILAEAKMRAQRDLRAATDPLLTRTVRMFRNAKKFHGPTSQYSKLVVK